MIANTFAAVMMASTLACVVTTMGIIVISKYEAWGRANIVYFMILCRQEYARAIDRGIFPGTQGGPLMHVIAGKAVCLSEALHPESGVYAQKVVDNAAALGEALKREGLRLVTGGTDNHLLLVDLRPFQITGQLAETALDRAGITVNKNLIPYDPQSSTAAQKMQTGPGP